MKLFGRTPEASGSLKWSGPGWDVRTHSEADGWNHVEVKVGGCSFRVVDRDADYAMLKAEQILSSMLAPLKDLVSE